MRQYSRAAAAAVALAATARATNSSSLATLCTVAHVQSALPANGTLLGIDMIPSSVTAKTATSSGYEYCDVSVSYVHTGSSDEVVLNYGFPSPEIFANRFYVAGGFGYTLSTSITGGLEYGAVGGATDAGYGALSGTTVDEVNLLGNGTINWDPIFMFAYKGLGEMTTVGKPLTRAFYNLDDEAKVYTYFEGCSDGGREGMSQIQRYGDLYDGAVIGAPAFRYGQQQVNHLFSAVVEQTLDYFPPPCELEKIVNATISACDPLDGRTDGVISRSDLCQLEFNLTSVIGESYYCAATTSTSLGFNFGKRNDGTQTTTTPAQRGNVTAEGVAVAQAIYDGLFNSQGERAYLSYRIGAEFTDAETEYDNSTKSWGLDIPSTGGEFVGRFIELLDVDNLDNLNNVTYDTLVSWMNEAMILYMDTLQTTLPDLTTFQSSGGKLIHYHGESDPSVPTASSVHYWQSVMKIMYPSLGSSKAIEQMKEWYQLYLVPGAAHCARNSLQPNGPFPEDNMATMIKWVESGVQPTGLNATVDAGAYDGEVQQLCQFPKRPVWKKDAWKCESDDEGADTFYYTFPAFKLPVY
ncbi:tannase and feruloyl esterase [Aspergillus brunneoviolaceus CBS 621.78]|uniref:Tannase and feruloyl esterase n=1 Tax=Aspergillus brunneoviolaceus CBS 621.78 TaxID=1450534 RepID=A0ACD1GDR6_9EURO|nr:tannase and feruloyl esterase [Aspergillus brunneoviolaceus CBS 621.78]RAH47408.1 tannase and feruloyl esterase [Aspergillus brunneoviolaceus CBS 621.78]